MADTPMLAIRNLRKSFSTLEILKDISCEIQPREFLVLVGPSGCGKSTLLNCIAGLAETTSGQILIDGRDVTHDDPAKRDLAMVFQSYALFPNMTVAQNIAFGLDVRRVPKPEQDRKTAEVAEILKIAALLDRRPAHLSGGQRQRVAMGRALVRDPKLFLFDEPLSNLDAKLRVTMRTEIKRLHRALGATMVYVTHDQIEAMTLATKILVMKDGAVQQAGTPDEVYKRPANTFVAGFMGSPPMNLIPAVVKADGGKLHIELTGAGGAPATLTDSAPPPSLAGTGSKNVIFGLRPEAFDLRAEAFGPRSQKLDVQIEVVENSGSDVFAIFTLGGAETVARLRAGAALAPGEAASLYVDTAEVSYFDPETGVRL